MHRAGEAVLGGTAAVEREQQLIAGRGAVSGSVRRNAGTVVRGRIWLRVIRERARLQIEWRVPDREAKAGGDRAPAYSSRNRRPERSETAPYPALGP
jgi:hypothetical protein